MGAVPTINLNAVRERVGNDEQLVQMLTRFFMEDVPGLQQQLRLAATDHNSAQIEHLAHHLKGLASNLDALSVMACARLLERLDSPPQWEKVNRLMDDLDGRIREVLLALHQAGFNVESPS